MNVNRVIVLLVFFIFIASSHVHAATKEKFILPTGAESWWVSQGSIHNGQMLYIKRFKWHQSVDNVIEFYKAHWTSDSDVPGYMESNVNGWRMISQLNEKQQWVVQVRANQDANGSEGMISLMPLKNSFPKSVRSSDKFTPMMGGGELISTTYSDSPTTAKTQTQIFSGRPSTIANRLKRYVQGRGWSLQDEYSHKDSVTQRFESSKRQLDVALVGIAGSKTLVFISEVAHASK